MNETIALPAFPITGGCQCGAVRYTLRAPPVVFYICHCSECQTQSSSGFGESMRVRKADLEISGELHQYERPVRERWSRWRVLPELRYASVSWAPRLQGHAQHQGGHARRHELASARRPYLDPEQAALGPDRRGRAELCAPARRRLCRAHRPLERDDFATPMNRFAGVILLPVQPAKATEFISPKKSFEPVRTCRRLPPARSSAKPASAASLPSRRNGARRSSRSALASTARYASAPRTHCRARASLSTRTSTSCPRVYSTTSIPTTSGSPIDGVSIRALPAAAVVKMMAAAELAYSGAWPG